MAPNYVEGPKKQKKDVSWDDNDGWYEDVDYDDDGSWDTEDDDDEGFYFKE